MTASPTGDEPRRRRNPRGLGGRLRADILAAATTLLERTGSEDAVTLRGVAREVGIAAPSIAPHFRDRTEIIDAVVAAELETLHAAVVDAFQSHDDPVDRLTEMCEVYVGYALANPGRYRIVVGRRFVADWEEGDVTMTESNPLMVDIMRLVTMAIQACVDAGVSSSTDAYLDMLLLWFALHGLVTVTGAITSVDWPDLSMLVAETIRRAARLSG